MKKTLSILVLAGFLLASPLAVAGDNNPENQDETTRARVEAIFDTFNNHDLEGIVALYHPEASVVTPSFPEPRFGRDVVRSIYKDHFDNIPGVHDEVTRIVAEGNGAAVEFTATWDQPTEADPEARGALKISVFLKFKDGLVIEDVTYYDRMTFEPAPDQSE